MDVNIGNTGYGWAESDEFGLLQFAVTSTHMTQAELIKALDRTGAKVHIDPDGVIAEIPADNAGNIISRLFTCHFMRKTVPQPS